MFKLSNFFRANRYLIVFLLCVLTPILLIDSMLLNILQRYQYSQHKIALEQSLNHAVTNLTLHLDTCIALSDTLYTDQSLYQFIDRSYEDNAKYYSAFIDFTSIHGLKYVNAMPTVTDTIIYTDNPTLLDGMYFKRLDADHLLSFQELTTDNKPIVSLTHSNTSYPSSIKLSLLRPMNYYETHTSNYLELILDYNALRKSIIDNTSQGEIVVWMGNQIVFSSDPSLIDASYTLAQLYASKQMILTNSFEVLDHSWTAVIYAPKLSLLHMLSRSLPEIMITLCTSIFLLYLVIHTTYVKEHEQQALLLSKKQAELNALVSQVNPHFLYNTLECICMRSLIKNEKETAAVIRDLSLLMRQMSSWEHDTITIEEEVLFVTKYLTLQKYRFDEKLSYEINVDPICYPFKIPKLTILSLVENACVHGIGSSLENGKITLNISYAKNDLMIIVSDTGLGMSPSRLETLTYAIKTASVASLKHGHGTGILNAYLRLKNCFQNHLVFEIISKTDQGTSVMISIKEGERL